MQTEGEAAGFQGGVRHPTAYAPAGHLSCLHSLSERGMLVCNCAILYVPVFYQVTSLVLTVVWACACSFYALLAAI